MSDGDDFRRAVLRVEAVSSGTWRLHLDCGHTRIVSGKRRPGFERITCTACVRTLEAK